MGCACSRENKLDKGNFSASKSDSPAHLIIQILVKNWENYVMDRKKIISDHSFIIQNGDVIRQEINGEVVKEGILYSFNDIEFDENTIEMLHSPIVFSLKFDEKYLGEVSLNNLRHALFAMSKESISLKDLENNTLNFDVYYCVTGNYFYSLRSLALNHLSTQEQIDIIHNILQKRNDEDLNFGKGKFQVRVFLGDFKTEIKLKIFETLVEVPDGRSRLAVKEFLRYYNPYYVNLQLSFKHFIKNVVAFEEGLEGYTRGLIEINCDDYLVYENKECLLIMLKHAFIKGEDPKGYFKNLLKKKISGKEKFNEMLEMPNIFQTVFLPNFKENLLKTIQICELLLMFPGFEEFLGKNWSEFKDLIVKQEIKDKKFPSFNNFLDKMEKTLPSIH